ncbi:general odorant-binding protein 72-like [Euwallacea similis]|uniref:general odorant-binding protein 72-like n=1 Tax=Euwallacea similis TaxID=1736056 RepID=UPI00345105CA
MTMKAWWVVFAASIVVESVYCAMTESQMAAALKLIRNVCQPKNKATNEQIEGMHKGDWNQDQNGMCYMSCVLGYYKLQLPDNSFDWETGVKTIEAQAPPSIAQIALVSVKNCKDAVKTLSDKCRAALEIAKCIYDQNPEKYFLP